ncbi:MAG: hypothetical protein CK532_01315 [Flavobacteriales bacterium]|nr:MAG: hypothetical protein CK532_01315 [Flavobacteriales bacterium]
MHFQQQNMLWGLLLLAIPLFIHLYQFHQTKTIFFPGVFRLTQQMQQSRRQKKTEHLLLLISRCLGIVCLVFAFAMPSCTDKNTSNKAQSNRIVVLFDNGLSMSARNQEGLLMEQARNQLRDMLGALNEESKVMLLTQNPLMSKQWTSPSQLISIIDTLDFVDQQVQWNDWLIQVDGMSKELAAEPISAVVFSDAQRSFLGNTPLVPQNKAIDWHFVQFDLEPGHGLDQGVQTGNLSIDSAWYVTQWEGNNQGNELLARIANYSDAEMDASVSLTSAGSTLQAQSITLLPGAVRDVVFILPTNKLHQPLQLQLEPDAFVYDNTLMIHPISDWSMQVGVIGSHPAFDAFFLAQPLLKKHSIGFPIKDAELAQLQALVLIGNPVLGVSDQEKLIQFMSDGKPVIQVLKEATVSNQLHSVMGDITGKWDASSQRIAMGGLSHPLFENIFSGSLSDKTQLPTIEGYFELQDLSDFESVLQLEGGQSVFINRIQGNGSFWIWLSDLNKGSQSLLQSSWFLPIFTQVIASKAIGDRSLYGIMHSKSLMALPADIDVDERAASLSANGVLHLVDLQQNASGQKAMYIGPEPTQPGYYYLKSPKMSDSILLAFNHTRSESDLRSVENWPKEFDGISDRWKHLQSRSLKSILDNESLNGLWRLFIWAAAFFFALEVALLVYREKIKRKEVLQP